MKIFLIIMVVMVVYTLYRFNALVQLKEAVKNSKAEISVQLDARGKLFDSLIATVNKVMSQEIELFTQIAKLRSGAAQARQSGNDTELKGFENELSKIVESGKISIAVENYPEMKSDRNMMVLQESIISSESRLASSKSGFNRALEKYKTTIQQIPDVFVVKIFKSLIIDEDYWKLEEAEIKVQEEKRVSFD